MSNDEIIKLRDELKKDCIFLNEYINLSTYIDIISEVLSLSKNIYSYCENIKKNYKNQHEVEGKCIGYIMSNIHLMSISFKTLNINHSDSKIIKLGNDLLELYLSNSYTKFNKTILDFLYSYGLPKLLEENEEIPDSKEELKKNIDNIIYNKKNILDYNSIKSCIIERISPISERLSSDTKIPKDLITKHLLINLLSLSRPNLARGINRNEEGFWSWIKECIEDIINSWEEYF